MADFDDLVAKLRRNWVRLPALAGPGWPELERQLTRLIEEGESGRLAPVVAATRIRVAVADFPQVYGLVTGPAEPESPDTVPPMPKDVLRRGDGPPKVEPPPPPRYVNLAFIRQEDFTRVPATQGLRAGGGYQLRVDLGRFSPESIIVNAPPVPTKRLPPTQQGHWLELTVTSEGFRVPTEPTHLYLPRQGASFTCPCHPGDTHTCKVRDRDDYAFITVTAPLEPGPGRLRVALWHRRNVVQSVLVEVDVVAQERDPGRQHAHVDFTLTHNLSDVESLRARAAGVLVNERGGSHTLVLNGVDDGIITVDFSEGTLMTAMDAFRAALLRAQLKQDGTQRRSLLGPANEKSRVGLVEDLARLAGVGADHWAALYPHAPEALPAFAKAQGDGMQIARVESSRFVFPWAGIYDLPLERRRFGHYDLCPLVEEWDGRAPLIDGSPTRCPREAEHARKNMLCPFGFWGFRFAIEQPASTRGRSLPLQIPLPSAPAAIIAQSLALDREMADTHLAAVVAALPGFSVREASSADEVCEALGEHALGLAYFYCHGRGTPDDAWIEVGRDEAIYPQDIATWAVVDWVPRDEHWSTTRPLVILNGCHTAELTPNSPVNFVDGLSSAGAAGIVGTEITVSQRLAGEAVELMLEGLISRQLPVGQALHRMRSRLLAKGNLLGLAYTAYCSNDLRFV
ncbi:hypothetical protein J5X84_42100 [Streptosporangiaceae bacterium NEAU-GS5]|nr:hypothetical protein [Streptosporangiaceae bacterium NEAU-GS5]